MATVIVERTPPVPLTGERLLALDERHASSLRSHAVRPLAHLLATNGRRHCCLFDAPDAESVRLALRDAGFAPAERVWPATLYGPVTDPASLPRPGGPSGRSLVLVERSLEDPIHYEDLEALEEHGTRCLTLNRITFLMSCFALDGRRMICLYDSPDVESVSRTNTRIGLPFDQVWSGIPYPALPAATPVPDAGR